MRMLLQRIIFRFKAMFTYIDNTTYGKGTAIFTSNLMFVCVCVCVPLKCVANNSPSSIRSRARGWGKICLAFGVSYLTSYKARLLGLISYKILIFSNCLHSGEILFTDPQKVSYHQS